MHLYSLPWLSTDGDCHCYFPSPYQDEFCVVVSVIVIWRLLKLNSYVFLTLRYGATLKWQLISVLVFKNGVTLGFVESIDGIKHSHHCGSLCVGETENSDFGQKVLHVSLNPDEKEWFVLIQNLQQNCADSEETCLFNWRSFLFSFHTFSGTYQMTAFCASFIQHLPPTHGSVSHSPHLPSMMLPKSMERSLWIGWWFPVFQHL